MKTELQLLEKELKSAERIYTELCIAYSNADDATEGALFAVLQAQKVYDDVHIKYSVEYTKAIGS